MLDMRNYIPTKNIRETPGKFNLKKISIKVPSHEVKKGGFFSSDFALFSVETEITGEKEKIKVTRKDNDFYSLRRLLRMHHPYILIPPLPLKNTKLVEKVLNRR